MIPLEPDKVRFNEKLDHLQARRPFTYNLVTGALIGLVLLLVRRPLGRGRRLRRVLGGAAVVPVAGRSDPAPAVRSAPGARRRPRRKPSAAQR